MHWNHPILRGSLLLLFALMRVAQAQHNDHDEATNDYTPTPPVMYPGEVRSLRDVIFAQPLGFRPLTLDLHLSPAGGAKKPVVVFIHGGAWRSRTARDGGWFHDFPAVLASVAARNYVVASVNYRFSNEARFPAAVQKHCMPRGLPAELVIYPGVAHGFAKVPGGGPDDAIRTPESQP